MDNNITIFYADDDSDDLDFFREATETIGKDIQLRTFPNGNKLLAALHEITNFPDILFLDLNMPGKNGFDVLKEMKSSRKYSHIPIVVLSTSNDSLNIEKSHELGANYFITKSNTFARLKKSIEFTLEIDWKNFAPSQGEFVYKGL